MVIAADDTRIGFPATRDLGSPPNQMWLYHIGPQWAKRLLLTGDTITGTEAADLGLVLTGKTATVKAAAPIQRRTRKAAGAKAPAVIKFRNDSGGSWVGIGKRPQWLRDELAAGKQLSDFAVK